MFPLLSSNHWCLFLLLFAVGCAAPAPEPPDESTTPASVSDNAESVNVITEVVKTDAKPIATTTQPKAKVSFSDLLRFNFEQAVEGYTVSVVWQPREETYGDQVIGPAILNFKKHSNNFSLTNNYFALPRALFGDAEEGKWRMRMSDFPATVPYQTPTFEAKELSIEAPFAFVDVDFDGNKELLLTKNGAGQRSVDSYEVYLMDNGDLELAYLQITQEDPYRYLDALSRIDLPNRELTIYSSGGACYSLQEIYTPEESGKLKLVKKIVYEMDDETYDCYRYDYTVRSGVDKLVVKKKVE